MSDGGNTRMIITIVLVVVGLGVVCCGGSALFGYFKVKEIVDLPPEDRAVALADMIGIDLTEEVALAESFATALDAGRFDEAYAMTSPAFQAVNEASDLEALHATIDQLGAFRSLVMISFGQRARVGTGGNFTEHTVVFNATFEHGTATISALIHTPPEGSPAIQSWSVRSSALGGPAGVDPNADDPLRSPDDE